MRSICLQAPKAPLKPCLVPSCSDPFALLPPTSYDWELQAGKVSERQMSEAHMKRKKLRSQMVTFVSCKFTQWGAQSVSHELSDHSATTGNFGEPAARQGMHPKELLSNLPGATFWNKGLLWT